ncbi:FG-GAP repeat domain-containing protein [Flexithrix dorotheae]|uniref:FG-GAP repeat domain-containing protein n=1 Tax=Flexithrix dorotheae TaxID=70993 RepID=UPI00047611EA|nr:VCBS repeat-containing protein [Flexithrix dorotheae]
MLFSFMVILTACCTEQKVENVKERVFEKQILSTEFYAEGVGVGDINSDQVPDIVAGPFWFKGPDFTEKISFYKPKLFDKKKEYSDNFSVAIRDVNEDNKNDILIIGFPGEAAYWYENHGQDMGYWEKHLIYPKVDNESPTFYDLTGDGRLELIFHTNGYLGYAVQNTDAPNEPWTFHAISKDWGWQKFSHGLGLGDINDDGRVDIMKNEGWWENPGKDKLNSQWTFHSVDFGPGGAQMYVMDIDKDGLNDVVTTLDAHGWGLAWFKQVRSGNVLTFEQQLIMGEKLSDNPYGVRFSQPHALKLEDIDKDGVTDLVSGKRVWTRGPQESWEPDEPAVVYWFKLTYKAGNPHFIPYLMDDDSGVGVDFSITDLDNNNYPDIITCNKNGVFVFKNFGKSTN